MQYLSFLITVIRHAKIKNHILQSRAVEAAKGLVPHAQIYKAPNST